MKRRMLGECCGISSSSHHTVTRQSDSDRGIKWKKLGACLKGRFGTAWTFERNRVNPRDENESGAGQMWCNDDLCRFLSGFVWLWRNACCLLYIQTHKKLYNNPACLLFTLNFQQRRLKASLWNVALVKRAGGWTCGADLPRSEVTAVGCLLLRSHSSVTWGRLATSPMRLQPLATLDQTCNSVIELHPCFVCSRFDAANKSSSVYLKLEDRTTKRGPGGRRGIWVAEFDCWLVVTTVIFKGIFHLQLRDLLSWLLAQLPPRLTDLQHATQTTNC